MRRYLCILAALAVLTPGAALAEKAKVAVKREDCAQVTRHQPAADVAYKPGVDVNGKSVTPADLNGGTNLRLPEKIEIPITIELEKRLGIPKNNLYKAEPAIGKVVWRNGKLWFNGQPLHNDEEARLVAACREALKKSR